MKNLYRLLATISLLGWPSLAWAQIQNIPANFCGLGLPCRGDIFSYVVWIVNVLLSFVAVAAVIVIIYAGVKYITAFGDETAAKEAKNVILYAVIGLLVIGLSAAIVNFVVLAINGVVLP